MFGLSVGAQIAVFLIEAVFSLYIAAILIRLLLGFSRADFHNPLSQFLVKITNPVLVPLRRFIPSIGKLDTSAILVAYALTLLKLTLIYLLTRGAIMFPESLFWAVGELAKSIVWIYIIALVIQAVISWIGSAHGNPVVPLINSLTNPILKPIRKVVPLVGMMDLSSLVAILGLNVILIIITNIFR